MAAVDVTISGVLYDKHRRTMQNVVLIGEASLTGVGVGGGPIIPPDQPPTDPGQGAHPSHPIYWPGGPPGEAPPGFWGGGMGPGVKPQPPFPTDPPPDPVEPPVKWKAVWHPTEGWVVVGIINPDIPHPTPSS